MQYHIERLNVQRERLDKLVTQVSLLRVHLFGAFPSEGISEVSPSPNCLDEEFNNQIGTIAHHITELEAHVDFIQDRFLPKTTGSLTPGALNANR